MTVHHDIYAKVAKRCICLRYFKMLYIYLYTIIATLRMI